MSIADPFPGSNEREFAAPRVRSSKGDLDRTLRATRDRLSARSGLGPFFERELLLQHATSVQAAAVVLPFPVVLTGFGLSIFTGPVAAAIWTLATLSGFLILVLIARHFGSLTGRANRIDLTRWTRIFLGGHFVAHLGYAYLATLECEACGVPGFDLFKFTIIFLAIAMIAMISSSLRYVVPASFLPLVLVLVAEIAGKRDLSSAAMNIVLLGAVPFFALVADRLRKSAAQRVSNQAEKDELIAELEIAQIVSEDARRRAEEANMAKSRFLASMSHELRTPLNAIIGFSEVMENEILGPIENENYKAYVTDIHQSGEHLLALINEILDLSRIEAGRYGLHEEAVDLVEVARDCLTYVRAKAAAKEIDLVAEFEPRMPALWADRRALRQIIINLLSNAVKFTGRNGRVVLRAGWTSGGGQYVAVADNGPGIPAHEIPLVLSSFGQGAAAAKIAEQGSGLGLPIVGALVKLHDGRFDLTSRLREGTEAVATFPVARVLEVMAALDRVA